MFRKIGYSLLCAGLLATSTALAAPDNFARGLSAEYELVPNEPQVFINYWYWTIDATCTIYSTDASSPIYVEALSKAGKVNGQPLHAGQSLVVVVHPNEKLYLSADSAAKVRLTNRGKHTITAKCST